ncbi:MAG: hypothetical protein ACUVTP_08540 [Candidatus Fervidibacter sp.]|uniref:hypothetical protein n=1 Tax=Candidatus Fervidibacter sp. TaxID=3100871 RepID=UPI00404A0600
MQQGKWLLLGFAVLIVSLLAAWRIAVRLDESANAARHPPIATQHTSEVGSIQVSGGQLVAEIPERGEKWVLNFASSHYDTDAQIATTKKSVCQVTRNGRVVTVFRAPTITVRFKDKEMEMRDGVTVIAMLPRLKVRLNALRWHWETGQLVGTGKVKIEGEQVSGIADGLEGDTTLRQISLKGAHLNWNTISKSGEFK